MSQATHDNCQLGLLSFLDITRPNLFISDDSLDQEEQQALLWGYGCIEWGEGSPVVPITYRPTGGFMVNIGSMMNR